MLMHVKRLSAPKHYGIKRKTKKFVVAPRPGPHPKDACIPLGVLIRDFLGYAENMREAKKIIKAGKVLVDGRPVKDHKFPVGFMDTITFEGLDEAYRIGFKSSKLYPVPIPKKEAADKVLSIKNKHVTKKGMIQVTLHDGRNIVMKECKYRVGDSLHIKVPEQKVVKHLPLEEGASVMVVKGKHAGVSGTLKEIIQTEGLEPPKVVIDTGKGVVRTLKSYVIVVGKDKPIVTLTAE